MTDIDAINYELLGQYDTTTNTNVENMNEEQLTDYLLRLSKQLEYKPNINELWEKASIEIEPLIYCKSHAYIKIKINNQEIDCLLDTGAQSNVLTLDLVESLNITSYMDTTIKTKVYGVGCSQSPGMIPYYEVMIGDLLVPMNFTVIENNSTDAHKKGYCIIGMTTMLFYKMQLDFITNKLKIMNYDVPIIMRDS